MKKEGALSKFGESEIDNQWFKGAKMTIVPRPFEDRSFFGYASDDLLRCAKRVARESPLQGGNGKLKMEN